MLNLAVIGALSPRPSGPAVGIERQINRTPAGLDPREILGLAVLTMPLVIGRHDGPPGPGPNLN